MPTFTYKGLRSDGAAVAAEITAADERAAARQLRSQGITVQSLNAKGKGVNLGMPPDLSALASPITVSRLF